MTVVPCLPSDPQGSRCGQGTWAPLEMQSCSPSPHALDQILCFNKITKRFVCTFEFEKCCCRPLSTKHFELLFLILREQLWVATRQATNCHCLPDEEVVTLRAPLTAHSSARPLTPGSLYHSPLNSHLPSLHWPGSPAHSPSRVNIWYAEKEETDKGWRKWRGLFCWIKLSGAKSTWADPEPSLLFPDLSSRLCSAFWVVMCGPCWGYWWRWTHMVAPQRWGRAEATQGGPREGVLGESWRTYCFCYTGVGHEGVGPADPLPSTNAPGLVQSVVLSFYHVCSLTLIF